MPPLLEARALVKRLGGRLVVDGVLTRSGQKRVTDWKPWASTRRRRVSRYGVRA
jgi:hypothetical protein